MTTKRILGDSLSIGYAASAPAKTWHSLLSSAMGWTFNVMGVSGSMTADLAAQMYGQTVASGDLAILRVGTNDARHVGSSSASMHEIYRRGLRAALAWLVFDMKKAKTSAVTYTGAWDETYVYGIGRRSTTNGSKAAFSVAGTSVFINMIYQDVSTGQFKVTIDGVSKGTFSCAAPGFSAVSSGVTYGPMGLRFDGLTDATHAVEIEVVSPTGAPNYVYFDAYGGNAPHASAIVCKIPNAASYPSGGSNALTADYNAIIDSVASEFGAVVSVVDLNTGRTAADTDGSYHENDSGQAKTATAIQLSITGPQLTGDAVVTWEGSSYFIARADGSGKKQIATL